MNDSALLSAFSDSLDPHSSDTASSAPDCVGCGWCCLTDQCNLSHELYGYRRPCPSLFWNERLERYVCLLMLDAEKREQYRRTLFQGEGCCARFNPWRSDVHERTDKP